MKKANFTNLILGAATVLVVAYLMLETHLPALVDSMSL